MLGLVAAAGIVASAAYVLVSTDLGRSLVVPRLVRMANDALAGHIELKTFRLLGGGGIELVGVRVLDPGGDEALRARSVRIYPDLSRLRSNAIGFRAQIDSPAVVIKREQDGSISLARAFAPARPSSKANPSGSTRWTIRITRLSVRNGSIRYVDATGRTALDAGDLAIDARASRGPRGARLELALRGAMVAPERVPIAVEIAGGLRGNDLRVRTCRVVSGDTGLDLAAEVDVTSWRGRAALLALAVDASQLHATVPSVPLAGDVTGTAYAESDGERVSAALDLRPKGHRGVAQGAFAVRLPFAIAAAGVDLHVAHLDLASVVRGAPASDLTLDAHGRAIGRDLATAHGSLAVSLAPSTLRGGSVGPAELRATANRGVIHVPQLDVVLPGGTIQAQGRWQAGGSIGGHAVVDARNVASLVHDVQILAARRLPVLAGTCRIEADVSGTTAAPAVALHLVAPTLTVSGVTARAVTLDAKLAGPPSAPAGTVEGSAEQLVAGGGKFDARSVRLRSALRGRAGDVSLVAELPRIAGASAALSAAGALSPDGRALQLSALALSWPGDRFELQAPAVVSLTNPSVDHLALASGPQRIELSGGLAGSGRRRTVDLTARLKEVDLSLLPRALLPSALRVAGRVDADLTVNGPVSAPRVKGSVDVSGGALKAAGDGSAMADPPQDPGVRLAAATVDPPRVSGARGRLEIRGDLPVLLLEASPTARLAITVVARQWPIDELLGALHLEPQRPLHGNVSLEARIEGTKGHPMLHGAATLEDGRYGDLQPFTVALAVDDTDTEAELRGTVDYRGERAADLEGRLAVSAAELVRDPATVAHGLPYRRLSAVARVPGFDLASVAGREGIPEGVRGRLIARVELTGSARAPRGTATVTLAGASYGGYGGVAGELKLAAGDRSTALELTASRDGQELVRGTGSLGLAVERLTRRAERESAPLAVRFDVPRVDLRRAALGTRVPLDGEVVGQVVIAGTLAHPRIDLTAMGRRLEISGRPLGDLDVVARADRAVDVAVRLAVVTGGTLQARLDAETGLGLPALRDGGPWRAPARARVEADQVDLGFVPALVPGTVRSASGKLVADVTASGPLRRMIPRGSVSLTGGTMSVAELGEWTNIALEASLSKDEFRLTRLEARRGDGKLLLEAIAKGLAAGQARITGELHTQNLTIPQAGQNLATVDIDARLAGTASAHALDLEVTIPDATVKLPSRPPRQIQTLATRRDIAVGPPRTAAHVVVPAARRPAPYATKVHVVSPGRFFVKSDSPRVNVELRADVTATYRRKLTLAGEISTVRGQVEPLGGRVFDVKRGRVQFTGGTVQDAVLELQAVYDNPQAKVNVAVTGTVEHPDVKLTSEPPMDESQIAMLIATGHTQAKPGSGGVGTLTTGEQGTAALGAVASQLFKNVIADKLPVDSVSLDSSQLRAGKYVTDKIYVGYTRRFNANPELGENTNEVRVEYQISPRWTFESRYGDAQTGGASLIWSKDY